jgi:uncharacterized integral membrane protein
MKIRPVGGELFRVDRQKDRYDEAIIIIIIIIIIFIIDNSHRVDTR